MAARGAVAGGGLERQGRAGHGGAEGVGAAKAPGGEGDGVGEFGRHYFTLVFVVPVRVGARI